MNKKRIAKTALKYGLKVRVDGKRVDDGNVDELIGGKWNTQDHMDTLMAIDKEIGMPNLYARALECRWRQWKLGETIVLWRDGFRSAFLKCSAEEVRLYFSWDRAGVRIFHLTELGWMVDMNAERNYLKMEERLL